MFKDSRNKTGFHKLHVDVLGKFLIPTIKGGCRRAKKSRKVLMMMMKAAKLGWAGPGAGQEQGRNWAGAELRIVKQSKEERGQEQKKIRQN